MCLAALTVRVIRMLMVQNRGGGRGRAARNQPPSGVSRPPDHQLEVIKVIYDLASICEGLCDAGPDPNRVDLRDLKGRLRGLYPHVFTVHETDVAQEVSDEDL